GINKTDFILLNDAFDFRSKKAQQFMTKMEDVFMLDTTDILNQSLIERIVLNEVSRIPKNEGILTREDIAQIFIGEEETREEDEEEQDDDKDEEKEEEMKRNKIIKEFDLVNVNEDTDKMNGIFNENESQSMMLSKSKKNIAINEDSQHYDLKTEKKKNKQVNNSKKSKHHKLKSNNKNEEEGEINNKSESPNENLQIVTSNSPSQTLHQPSNSLKRPFSGLYMDYAFLPEMSLQTTTSNSKPRSDQNSELQEELMAAVRLLPQTPQQSYYEPNDQKLISEKEKYMQQMNKGQNLQARRLWQMISPQSDFSVSEITNIAEMLMNGLWLFQQRPKSFFGDNTLDLEQEIVKFDVLNNQQLETNNDEQHMSIAGTCGWTMEHMKQLIQMSAAFKIPPQDKDSVIQSNSQLQSGVQILSEDKLPLRNIICQQGTFRPEIILVLEGQVDIYQKDFDSGELKEVNLKSIIQYNNNEHDYHNNNDVNNNGKGTIINQSRLASWQIQKIAQIVSNHAQKEISDIIERQDNNKTKQIQQDQYSQQKKKDYQSTFNFKGMFNTLQSLDAQKKSPLMKDQSLNEPITQSQLLRDFRSSSSIINLLPPPVNKSKKSRNNVLYSPPKQYTNRKDDDSDEDQRLSLTDFGNGHKTFAKKTIKQCIDLLFPSRCPYTIVASAPGGGLVLGTGGGIFGGLQGSEGLNPVVVCDGDEGRKGYIDDQDYNQSVYNNYGAGGRDGGNGISGTGDGVFQNEGLLFNCWRKFGH
ncbi:MAG: hypothetical protein EZS28_019998, partial [Streblomastix strix]